MHPGFATAGSAIRLVASTTAAGPRSKTLAAYKQTPFPASRCPPSSPIHFITPHNFDMSASERLKGVLNHLGVVSSGRDELFKQSPDDIVITLAIRTPLTKAKKGGLKDTSLEDLLISIQKSVIEKMVIPPAAVEEIIVGNVLAGDVAYIARATCLAAGFPTSTTTSIANRFCSSGLLAISHIANAIATNTIQVGLAIGAESMSNTPDNGAPKFGEGVMSHPLAAQNLQPMGQTSENVAGDFGISRAKMDAFAALSQQKAAKAQAAGWFADEIVPVSTPSGLISADDGVRAGTTAEGLAKIRNAFPQWPPSNTTGGNASQVTDGAAAVLLMKRSTAAAFNVPVLARFVGAVYAGLEPRIMGIGPALSIPKILTKYGLKQEEVDVYEINEAFASMGVYVTEKLGLEVEKVNPRGGAIALGHPLGCTGARQVVTALSELRRTNKKIAVTSMCVGTGQAMAGLLVNEV